jgi:hypothetical protein
MGPVIAEHPVTRIQDGADAGRNGFLSDAQMYRTAHFLFMVTIRYGFLDAPDSGHRTEQRRKAGALRRVRPEPLT